MSENVAIRISAEDLASPALKSVSDKLAELGVGVDEAGRKATNAGSKLDDLKGKLTAFAAFGATVAAAGGGLFAIVNKVAELGEKLLLASQRTGVSVESLSTLKFAAEQSNVPFETLTRSLYLFNVRVGTAAEKSGEAEDAFNDLGVKIRDASGDIRPTYDLFLDVADALSGLKSDADRARLAQELFGRGAQDIVPFVRAGKDAILAAQQQAAALGLELSTKSAVASDTFRDSIDALKGSVSGLTIGLTQDLVPVLTSGVEWMTKWVGVLREATTFDPTRQQGMQRLVEVTDEQAEAAQNASVQFGLFAGQLSTSKDTMLTVQDRGSLLRAQISGLKGTVTTASDALDTYRANFEQVRVKVVQAKEAHASAAPKIEDVGAKLRATAFDAVDFDLKMETLAEGVDETTEAWRGLDEALDEPIQWPELPEPPRETFGGFLRGLGGSLTEPAGKDVIQTALVNAFTSVSQGGGFKNAIGAVGVAIGGAIGGPVGAAIAGFVTRGLFAGATTPAAETYKDIAGLAVEAVSRGGIGMAFDEAIVGVRGREVAGLREKQRDYRAQVRRGGERAGYPGIESLARELRSEIPELSGAESLIVAEKLLREDIYGPSGQQVNDIIRGALLRRAVAEGRASEFRAGISEQAASILAAGGEAPGPAQRIVEDPAAAPPAPAAAPAPKTASLSAAISAFQEGRLVAHLDSLASSGGGVWNNLKDYFMDAFSGTRNQAAMDYLTSQGWVISAQAGLSRVPGPTSAAMPAVLHGGEMVLPATQAERVREGGMMGGVTVNFYLQSASDREVVEMIRGQLPMIERAVADGIRKGARFGTQQFDERMIRTVLQS